MAGIIIQMLLVILPWGLRRAGLCRVFGFDIHPTSRIGLSLILPVRLVMGPHSRIGHLTVIKGLDVVQLDQWALLGNLNWITGLPSSNRDFFKEDKDRHPGLYVGEHAAITHRHMIDCSDRVTIGGFATFAGWGSQILTHSISISLGRQSVQPVDVGRYCFVGTRTVLLKGARLPEFSVLAAGSVLSRSELVPYGLFSGNPATRVRDLNPGSAYFERSVGFVK